jgi:hypothetical protein
VRTAASINQKASALPRWCAVIRLRCGSITARCGFTVLREKFAGGDGLSTKSDHDLVLECLRQVTDVVSERTATMIEIVVTFDTGIAEFWTTNPAPLTMVRGKGSTH